jgi:hypothetical protein
MKLNFKIIDQSLAQAWLLGAHDLTPSLRTLEPLRVSRLAHRQGAPN